MKLFNIVLIGSLTMTIMMGCTGSSHHKAQRQAIDPFKDAPKWVIYPDVKNGIGVAATAPACSGGVAFQRDVAMADAYFLAAVEIKALMLATLDDLKTSAKAGYQDDVERVTKRLVALETEQMVIPGLKKRDVWFNSQTGELWAWYAVSKENIAKGMAQALAMMKADKEFIREGVSYLDKNIKMLKEDARKRKRGTEHAGGKAFRILEKDLSN